MFRRRIKSVSWLGLIRLIFLPSKEPNDYVDTSILRLERLMFACGINIWEDRWLPFQNGHKIVTQPTSQHNIRLVKD